MKKKLNTLSETEILAATLLLNKKAEKKMKAVLDEQISSLPQPKVIQGLKGDQGLPGRTGEPGPMGPIGPMGPEGPAGPQGIKGDKGDVGEKGEKGDKGDKGETGAQGIQGEIGPQGEKGEKGDTGERGPQGIQGIQGEKGDPGIQGKTGARGPKGAKGAKGAKGLRGDKGPPGVQGLKGDKGDKGDPGPMGPTGPQGEMGERGPEGTPGKDADIEEPIRDMTAEFNNLKNRLMTQVNMALTNIAMSSGGGGSSGGGSVNILDNDDVIFERLENVLNNSVLVFDTALQKFKAVSIVDLINSVRQELEVKYTKLIDNAGTITYIGEALPGTAEGTAEWRIYRFDESADPDLEIKWADGNADFDKTWTNRATYTYS